MKQIMMNKTLENKKKQLVKLLGGLSIQMTPKEIDFYVGKLDEKQTNALFEHAKKIDDSFKDLVNEAMKKDPEKTKALLENYEADKKKNDEAFKQKIEKIKDKYDRQFDEYVANNLKPVVNSLNG